jgi:hypothetical protein
MVDRLKTSVAQILFKGSVRLHCFGARLVISLIAVLREVNPVISYPKLVSKGMKGFAQYIKGKSNQVCDNYKQLLRQY